MECSASASPSAYKNKHKGMNNYAHASAFEERIELVASSIYERHPSHRRCSVSMIKTKLRLIAKRSPKEAREERLGFIDANHKKWCAYWATKDQEYVKSLENWLAPTMNRFDEDPPTSKVEPERQRFLI